MEETIIGRVKFLGYMCDVIRTQYAQGESPALCLITEDGEPMCTASVNLPGLALEADEVVVKDYSENEGVQKALINAGILAKTGKRVATGFVTCDICKIIV